MTVVELKAQLRAHPELNVIIILPDGRLIPAHYHVTEVGHIDEKFVDCGGTFRASATCLLQTYVGRSTDDGHRLSAGKLARILDLAKPILLSDDLPVEVEYEAGAISQFPLERISAAGGAVRLHLGSKHTDCLAKVQGGLDESEGCCTGSAAPAGC